MERRNISTVIGAVLGALMAVLLLTMMAHGVAPAEEMREEFHQTYTLAAGGRVDLSNINGNVIITGTDGNQVKVDAVKYADTAERLKEIQIVVEATPDLIHIKTKYPEGNNTYHGRSGNVDYTIQVPKTAKLEEIKLVNGSLKITDVTGSVHASSVNGRVTAAGLAGDVKLSSVNGEVQAAIVNAGSVHMNSVNGRVALTIPSDSKADVSASTVNGAINNDFGFYVDASRHVGRKLKGRLGSGGTEIKLSTVNGSIDIHHAADGKPLSKATDELERRHQEPL